MYANFGSTAVDYAYILLVVKRQPRLYNSQYFLLGADQVFNAGSLRTPGSRIILRKTISPLNRRMCTCGTGR